MKNNKSKAAVIIPAHNEEAVIGRCLHHLTYGVRPGELEIIVVCNGCNDATADIAREFNGVNVVETDVASKTNALNLGDMEASVFPRIYVDADVIITSTSVFALASRLNVLAPVIGAPVAIFDTSKSSRAVRAFYNVWQRHPYFDGGRVGSGVVGVSRSAHYRIGPFPDVTADDEWVRSHFRPHERVTPDRGTFIVTAPKTLADLIQIKTRSRRGNMELDKRFPTLQRDVTSSRLDFFKRINEEPKLLPQLFVYFYVVARTYWRARQTLGLRTSKWERDLSSRSIA